MSSTIKAVIALFLALVLQMQGNAQDATFEEAAPFYARLQEQTDKGNIVWGYLNVPESWEKPQGKKVKVAITVLKRNTQEGEAKAMVFLQGGPGASGVQTIWTWYRHPLRKTHDIVLLDVRGTGHSSPRLCPDLGKEFVNILAKNQSAEQDEKEKSAAALSCRQQLINEGVDITAYNSISVANDLHALKKALNYKQWSVYGASYGTYMAQVYTSTYPEDVQKLILDSVIDDISTYYVNNSSNYMESLKKVFEQCKKDGKANAQYPDLENVYYGVIKDLTNNPLTVSVDKEVVASGKFTFNVEDFKIAIQQALYNKQLVEVIPVLIYQFRNRNKDVLGNLVGAFSALASMDYGVYYCVSCTEVLPRNNYTAYEKKRCAIPWFLWRAIILQIRFQCL